MSERSFDSDRLAAVPGYAAVRVAASTGSTNADLAALARAGTGVPQALLTADQTAGRGRLDRVWVAPPDTAIACSVLLVPPRPPAEWSWLPLLAGVAVSTALETATGLSAGLKWPNDVLVGEPAGKVAGILAERVQTPDGPACVVGVGLNVELDRARLPTPTATALNLASATTLDRTSLAVALLAALAATVAAWDTTAYARWCRTLGRDVTVQLPTGPVSGRAVAIDDVGRLVVATPTGRRSFSAGDVTHLR